MATQIKLRRDTADNWETNNPTLASGEPGFVTDSGLLKIGDGTTAWNDLAGIETGSGGGGMEIGTIYPYAGTVAPIGSFICDGSAVSRTEYADLFAAIGTTWGTGDGSTTFNLPDLRGAFVRGTGSHGTETMANGSAFAGPAVGAFEDDQMQGHEHEIHRQLTGTRFSTGGSGGSSLIFPGAVETGNNDYIDATTFQGDGTNGTPRTGDETRPFAAGVTYCIKAFGAVNILENATPAAVKSVSSDYTITGRTDSLSYLATTGASDLTLTLPAGSNMIPGDTIDATKVDSGSGKLIVSRAGSDTIEGATTIDLPSQWNRVSLRWTGAAWVIGEIDNDDTDWNVVTTGFSNGWAGDITYIRRQGHVTVSISLDGTSNTGNIVYTLPISYRPSASVYRVYGSATGLSGTDVPLVLFVDDSGNVTIDGNGSANSVIRGQVAYPVI